MKKKISIIIVLLLFLVIDLDARANTEEIPLDNLVIFEVGVGDEKMLELDGLLLMSTNVNFNQVGSYQAQYYDPVREVYTKRRIEVVNQEELLKGTIYKQEVAVFETTDTIKQTVYETSDSFYVVGNRESKDDPIQTNFTQTYGFVRYYVEGQLRWERLFDEVYSEINDAVLATNGLVVLMSFEVGVDNSDLVIFEITKNNQITREFQVGGNEIDRGRNLYLIENRLYCFVISSSTTGEIGFSSLYNFLGVLILDYPTFSLEKKQMMGNSVRTDILDVEYHEAYSTFYLLVSCEGVSGSFRGSDGRFEGWMLVRLGLDGRVEKTCTLNVTMAHNPLFVVEDSMGLILVSQSNLSYHEIDFVSYDASFVRQESFSYTGKPGDRLLPQKVKNRMNTRDTMIAMKQASDSENQKTSLLLVHRTGCHRLELQENAKQILLERSHGIFVTANNEIVRFVSVFGTLHSREVHHFKEYVSYNLFVQYEYGGVLGLPLKQEMYGEYQHVYASNTVLVSLFLKSVYYQPFRTNLKHQEIYDVGTTFDFNGIGYLNGVLIQSGEKINNPGQYELVILGQDERKIFHFEIRKLSIDLVDEEGFRAEIKSIDLNEGVKPLYHYVKTEVNFEEKEEPVWLVVVAILAVLFGAGWVVPTKRGRKKWLR